MRRHQPQRRGLDAHELTICVERLLPLVLALVHAAERLERARAQPRRLGHLFEESLRAIEQSRAQVVLSEREQRLLTMLGGEFLPGEQVLMDADRAQ